MGQMSSFFARVFGLMAKATRAFAGACVGAAFAYTSTS